ncbi:MFS transporter [Ligilactobacillus sp. LYQ60]|uniref:MFS transporter n=1 Tax=unclassified Ligilactobacillus TaxID=2767920 RepID=UPI003852363C
MRKKSLITYYLLINCLYAAGIGIWSGTIYLYMRHIGYSNGAIDFFLLVFWIVSFLTEIPTGMLADRIGQLPLTMISCIFRAAGLLAIIASQYKITVLLLGASLTALGQSLYSGSLDSWIINCIKANSTVISKVFTYKAFLNTLTTMISGYIGAEFLGNIDLRYPLWGGILLLLLSVPLIQLLIIRTHTVRPTKSKNDLTIKCKIRYPKISRNQLIYFIFLLSVLFITTNPYNQWQLFFQKPQQHLKTGDILVLINIAALIGEIITKYIKTKKTNQLFMWQVFSLTVFLFIVIQLRHYSLLLSIISFSIYTLVAATNEVLQSILLQQSITTTRYRTTLTSVFNSLESLFSILIIGINGLLVNRFGIGITWLILAVVGLIILGFSKGYLKRTLTR